MEIPRSVRAVLLVPLLMACLSGPALAQDSTAYLRRLRGIEIPLPEAQFVLYQYVAGSDDVEPDERLQAEVRSELGFGNARFYALIDHMRETIAASRKFADARNSAICARRTKLESVQALGSALNDSTEALRKHQAGLMEEAWSILGPDGEPKFVALLEQLRERMVVNRVDYTALLVAQQIEVPAALEQICRQADEAARPAVDSQEQAQEPAPGQG